MVGLGGANAGELVVGGRGVAFVCLEHFTGRVNPETYGMGLPSDLIPLWIGHELAHTVRYTSPTSGSDMRRLVAEAGGYYDYWSTGSRASLRELLVNEGLAVHAAQAVAPGFDAADYFGYPRRQYHRLREMEAFLRRVVEPDLEQSGLGLRLRYLSGGMSPTRAAGRRPGAARAVGVLPGLSDDRGAGGGAGRWRRPCGRRRWTSSRRRTWRGGSRPRRPAVPRGYFPTQKLANTRSSTSSTSTAPTSSSRAVVASRTWCATSTASPMPAGPRARSRAPVQLERSGGAARRASAVRWRARVSAGSRSAERDALAEHPLRRRAPKLVEPCPGHRRHADRHRTRAASPSRSGLVRTSSVGRAPAITASSSCAGRRPVSTQSSTRSAAAR